jgi:hypothetical protein
MCANGVLLSACAQAANESFKPIQNDPPAACDRFETTFQQPINLEETFKEVKERPSNKEPPVCVEEFKQLLDSVKSLCATKKFTNSRTQRSQSHATAKTAVPASPLLPADSVSSNPPKLTPTPKPTPNAPTPQNAATADSNAFAITSRTSLPALSHLDPNPDSPNVAPTSAIVPASYARSVVESPAERASTGAVRSGIATPAPIVVSMSNTILRSTSTATFNPNTGSKTAHNEFQTPAITLPHSPTAAQFPPLTTPKMKTAQDRSPLSPTQKSETQVQVQVQIQTQTPFQPPVGAIGSPDSVFLVEDTS